MALSDKTELEIITAYAAAKEQNDTKTIFASEAEALTRLQAYLAGKLSVAEDESPMFFSFVKTFSKTKNVELNLASKKAEAKITPLLKEYDKTVGLDGLSELSAEKVEENIAVLDRFDTFNPFEKKDGELIYPQFQNALKIIEAVELTENDRPVENRERETEAFKETIVETAKLKTYMRLCIYGKTITQDVYLNALRFQIEKALVTLFVMEQTTGLALNQNSVEDVEASFQKLLDLL